jgi:hypothetical protein
MRSLLFKDIQTPRRLTSLITPAVYLKFDTGSERNFISPGITQKPGISTPQMRFELTENLALAKFEFDKEKENQEILRDALAKHKRIATFLEIIGIGAEFTIFSPLASMDLREFLYNQDPTFNDSFQPTLEHIVEEAKNLVGAFNYRHDEIKIPQNCHLSCFHMDLKPENILI